MRPGANVRYPGPLQSLLADFERPVETAVAHLPRKFRNARPALSAVSEMLN